SAGAGQAGAPQSLAQAAHRGRRGCPGAGSEPAPQPVRADAENDEDDGQGRTAEDDARDEGDVSGDAVIICHLASPESRNRGWSAAPTRSVFAQTSRIGLLHFSPFDAASIAARSAGKSGANVRRLALARARDKFWRRPRSVPRSREPEGRRRR